ncbi:MAG: hypothetical protein FWG88_11075 [Oscillospiraceae bacterium]|nr:hypothetical protein [Oscillospiraceae bacterium]
MNKRLRLFTYVVCLTLLFISSGCKSQKSMMEDMKKEIPNAVKFVEEHEENLSFLLDIQNRLDDVTFVFTRNEVVNMHEARNGGSYKRLYSVSMDECTLIDEKEKDAITSIFNVLDNSGYLIEVTPEFIQIIYQEMSQGKSIVSLRIENRDNFNYNVSNTFTYEIVNETWTITVFARQRG